MMTNDAFWQRVHELLDAHRDPLSDDEVVAYLIDHDAVANEFARLREALDQLPTMAASSVPATSGAAGARAPRTTAGRRAAAAAAVLVGLGALAWATDTFSQVEPEAPSEARAPTYATDGIVYRFELIRFRGASPVAEPRGSRGARPNAPDWLATRSPLPRQVVAIETEHHRHEAAMPRRDQAPALRRFQIERFDRRARVVTARP